MILLGKSIKRLAWGSDTYAPYFVGFYRGDRNGYLRAARLAEGSYRSALVQLAKNCHRDMQRCLREARRDQLARGGV